MPAVLGQLAHIEAHWTGFERRGIDRIVTVTTDPLDALRQEVQLERLTSPVLADVDRQASAAYDTLSYGMMGGSTSPEGQAVAWRTGVPFPPGIIVDGRLVAHGRPSERRLRRELDRPDTA